MVAQRIQQDRFDWFHFVALSGDEGRRWAGRYRRHDEVAVLSDDSLLLLRQGRLEEGRQAIERMRVQLDEVRADDPSIRTVLDRWYYGVLGYYWYCRGDLDEADRTMELASAAVARSIELRPCLLPLAGHCHEFLLHRARIARNGRRWSEMRRHIEAVRRMMDGSAPFCVLGDGTPAGLERVRRFYEALGSLSDEERDAVANVLDDRARMRSFERFVRDMLRFPGFVIAYP